MRKHLDMTPPRPYLMRMTRSAKSVGFGLAFVALTAVAGCAPRPPVGCVIDLPGGIGGPFSLIDESGKAVTQADFLGRPALLYFGFTFCPDVCPFSLQSAKLALDSMGPKGRSVQPVLISLDPERDTPQVLAHYVLSDGFPTGLRGLTGTQKQVAEAAKTYKVGWGKTGAGPDYQIEHTSFFFVLDRKGHTRALYSSDLDPESAGACMDAALR